MAASLLSTPVSFDANFDGSNTSVVVSVVVGSGANRMMLVSVTWNDAAAHSLGTPNFNGDNLQSFAAHSDNANCRKQTFWLAAPDVGTFDLTVPTTGGIGAATGTIDVVLLQDAVQTAPNWTTPTTGQDTSPGTDDATNAEITIAAVTNGFAVALFGGEFATTATAVILTGVTEQVENHNSSISSAVGTASGGSVVTAGATWTVGFGSVDWITHGINVGPSDTTPAQVARIKPWHQAP